MGEISQASKDSELDMPWLDLFQALHILYSLLHVPDLIRINHQNSPRRPRILPPQLCTIRVPCSDPRREERRVVDERPNELPAPQIVRLIRTNLHLEVIKPMRDRLFGKR